MLETWWEAHKIEFIVAGIIWTVVLVGWFIYHLSRNPWE